MVKRNAQLQCRNFTHIRRLSQQTSQESSIDETMDSREEVSDTQYYPHNTTGLILSSNAGETSSSSQCTGAIIAASYVLTAAHCIHNPFTGAEIASASFSPGYDTDLDPYAPYGSSSMVNFTVPTAFIDCGTGQYTDCHRTILAS